MSRIIRLAAALSIALLALSVKPNNRIAVQLTPALASQDATTAWNSVCATYEFPQVGSTTPTGWTFAQAWASTGSHVNSFSDDLAGVLSATASAMSTGTPIYHGDDTFKFSVTNWPDQ